MCIHLAQTVEHLMHRFSNGNISIWCNKIVVKCEHYTFSIWSVLLWMWTTGHISLHYSFVYYHAFDVTVCYKQCTIVIHDITAENVNEYLRLSAVDDSNVDRQQAHRVKAAFEKRNQKSTQTIAQLQRKLEMYSTRLRELEETGVIYPGGSRQPHRQARTVLKDVSQGIKLVILPPLLIDMFSFYLI